MVMQRLPGGLCFAHGPYTDGYECPQWPKCATDPQQEQWVDLAFARSKRWALLRAAELLEKENLVPETVAQLRHKAEKYNVVDGDRPR
jgi:hypothetical protein